MTEAPAATPRVGGLCLLAAGIMLTYAVASPAVQALFLTHYGSHGLPAVWLAVAVASAAATAGVNAAGRRFGIVRMLAGANLVSGGVLAALLVALGPFGEWAAAALYVYKDIYIIVLVELFWTFANLAFRVPMAARTYGLFCAAGSIGGLVGAWLAYLVGSTYGVITMLWPLVPLFVLCAWGCWWLGRHVPLPGPVQPESTCTPPVDWHHRINTVVHSPYLLLLMALVGVVQTIINLNDYQFSASLEHAFATEADRTHAIATVTGVINGLSLALQLITHLVLRWAGMPQTMLCLPLVLAIAHLTALVHPRTWTAAMCQAVGKCIDYSLFRACKEILYIPLTYAEKTRGKAVVDIMVYRVAKGMVGLVLFLAVGRLEPFGMRLISLLFCLLWLALARAIVQRYRRLRAADGAVA